MPPPATDPAAPARAADLRVAPLTAELAAQMRVEAALALEGDGSCSLEAMTTSCFASERCSMGQSGLQLDMLLTQPHAFVAVDAAATDARGPRRFVGCVSAAPVGASSLHFPAHAFEPDALMLSNLCVADRYRGLGVGRKLMQAIFDLKPPVVYLMIAAHGLAHRDPQVARAFEARVARLRKTYARLAFHEVPRCYTDTAILLCRRCPSAAARQHG